MTLTFLQGRFVVGRKGKPERKDYGTLLIFTKADSLVHWDVCEGEDAAEYATGLLTLVATVLFFSIFFFFPCLLDKLPV